MNEAILDVNDLDFPWQCRDPFLFCVHHDDAYPAGDERMGPAASLAGRRIGMDFEGKDGWRMYHGDTVPGFPQHPHRGFETVTIVRRGTIDHSDSLGATARFGEGDVQWLTAGRGIVHSEMFPLLERDKPNPLELFQIWLNLPAEDKLVDPHFSMLWSGAIPIAGDAAARVIVIAGAFGEVAPPSPPPKSWAARPDGHVAIWTVALAPNAKWTLPKSARGVNRTLYAFRGGPLRIASEAIEGAKAIGLRSEVDVAIENGPQPSELLLLQGRPIGEEVVQYGPFVMNSPAEIQQAFADYRRTGFGGWPWPSDGPVHARNETRHAKHADGRLERSTDS
jgi:redox-sensitive bicupin YhaK (pirin superfamily)